MEFPNLAVRHHSSLFTVRLWQEDLGKGSGEVRMQVKHVFSGETALFSRVEGGCGFYVGKVGGEQG